MTHEGARSWWSPTARAATFYALCAVLLLLAMTKQLSLVLPDGLAGQVGHNSEAFLFAALVSATIQLLRVRRPATSASWAAVSAFAASCVTLALLLENSDLPSSVVTLNEPLVAAGLMAFYVNLPRPVRWPFAWSGAVLLGIVVFFDTSLVRDQAESLVPMMIAPIALDVVDRSLLDPREPDRPARRWVWCAFLVAVAACAMVLARAVRPDLSGPIDHGIDYAQRAAEAYWGWLLIHLYLGFWLPWRFRWSEPPARHRAEIAVRP